MMLKTTGRLVGLGDLEHGCIGDRALPLPRLFNRQF
jgi:hypothetical protein